MLIAIPGRKLRGEWSGPRVDTAKSSSPQQLGPGHRYLKLLQITLSMNKISSMAVAVQGSAELGRLAWISDSFAKTMRDLQLPTNR